MDAAYYTAMQDAEKAAFWATATMAFVGGYPVLDCNEWYRSYYETEAALVTTNPMASSWQDIRCWRPVVDGEVVYDRVEGGLTVPNWPAALPTGTDKVVILEHCAMGCVKRYGFYTAYVEGLPVLTPWPHIGEPMGDTYYVGTVELGGGSITEHLDMYAPDPDPPSPYTSWYTYARYGPYYEYPEDEPFAEMMVVGYAFLVIAREQEIGDDASTWNEETGEFYQAPISPALVTTGSALRSISLYDTARLAASGYRTWFLQSPVLLSGDSDIVWSNGAWPESDIASGNLPQWEAGLYQYPLQFTHTLSVHAKKQPTLYLPPTSHAYFYHESAYPLGLIYRATFDMLSAATGGRFMEGFPETTFTGFAENRAPIERRAIFQENAANRAPLLRGGEFRGNSVNMQGPASHWRDQLGGWNHFYHEFFSDYIWIPVSTPASIWQWLWTSYFDVPDLYLYKDQSTHFLADVTSKQGLAFAPGWTGVFATECCRGIASHYTPFGADYPFQVIQAPTSLQFDGGPYVGTFFRLTGYHNGRHKFEDDLLAAISWDGTAWVMTGSTGTVLLTADGDYADPRDATWTHLGISFHLIIFASGGFAPQTESGQPAYSLFTDAAADGDWDNPANWTHLYGGQSGDLPTLRTICRITANVTANNSPVLYGGGPSSRPARCRRLLLDPGVTVAPPVLAYETTATPHDHPQSAGFSLQ